MDAISFIGLNVFASVLTGNTVLLGLAISTGNILNVIVPLVAITGFIGGVALGNRLAEPNLDFQKKIWPATVTKALLVEVSGSSHIHSLADLSWVKVLVGLPYTFSSCWPQ